MQIVDKKERMININTKAIYTLISDGEKSCFRSDTAGGYSFPLYLYNTIKRMVDVINNNYPMGKVTAAEIAPLMKADHVFPETVQGKKVLEPVDPEDVSALFENFRDTDEIPFAVSLDFDRKVIGFSFNKNCPEMTVPDVRVTVSNAELYKYDPHSEDPKLSFTEN